MKKVLVVMGSDSDLKVMEKCVDRLKSFDIPTEVRICSAHRTPAVAEQLAKNAAAEGFGVIIGTACSPSCRCPRAFRWQPLRSTAQTTPLSSQHR